MFAMLTSYVLSRTLVPTLAKYWLRVHGEGGVVATAVAPLATRSGGLLRPLRRLQAGFEMRFERVRAQYREILVLALERRRAFMTVFLGAALVSLLIYPLLGRNFFPRSTPGRSSCTCAHPPGCAWRTPQR